MPDAYLPKTFEQLEDLLEQGILVEGHTVDFKREMHTGKAANVGIAKDIAAFAVDGGQLYIGVDEGEVGRGPATVHPVPLAGLKERIDEIARSRIDPPVHVRCTELAGPEGDGTGCLVVAIPPTSAVAHQVDGRFMARSDTTNYVLSSAQLEDLYRRQSQQQASTAELLAAEVLRDPVPANLRDRAHMFLIAHPTRGRDEMLFRALGAESFPAWFNRVAQQNLTQSQLANNLGHAGQNTQRAGGWGRYCSPMTAARGVDTTNWKGQSEERIIDLEVLEGGGIRVFSGRGTKVVNPGDTPAIADGLAALLAVQVCELARIISEACSYTGSWDLGFAATGLAGSHLRSGEGGFGGAPYSADTYERIVSCTSEELSAEPTALAEKLVDPLLRGYGGSFRWDAVGRPSR